MTTEEKIDDLLKKTEKLEHEHRAAVANIKSNESLLSAAEDRLQNHAEALAILQSLTARLQNRAQVQISKIVTRCLDFVFDDPYTFAIVFEEKRGKTEARLTFKRDDMEIDPLTASGGGVIDVASFALRLAALVLSKPRRRNLLVLDEPFKHLSTQYRPAIRELLLVLAREYEVQIIMVTHDSVLTIGNVVEVAG